MTLQILMNSGQSAQGGVGVGLMTEAGNPWTVSDALANTLVNQGRASPYNWPTAGVVSNDGNSVALLWSGSASTAVPAASGSAPALSVGTTVTMTAGAGVTLAVGQVEASLDGSAWTAVGQMRLTAPGSTFIGLALRYPYLRLNITQLAGGSASGSVTGGPLSLAIAPGTVLTNPTLTGVPAAASYVLYQSAIPVMQPSSGSIGNNGALTLTTALPYAFPACWMYFPANAIASGSAAGLYFVQMSSTTAGTIYNNTLSAGEPSIPASPTPFVTTGPGAYTQFTGSSLTLLTLPLLGGAMGTNGALRLRGVWLTPSNTNTKNQKVYLNGVEICYLSFNSQLWMGFDRMLRNMGSQALQIGVQNATNFATDVGLYGSNPTYTTINTAVTQNITFAPYMTVATDYAILAGYTIEVLPKA